MYSDKYSGSYKIISLGPKAMLKTIKFEKKATFPVNKTFWPTFSRIIEFEKRRGTIYKSPQGILTVTVEVTRSFL